MCYFNRLTRVARWLADYPEWLQFWWDFVKPPRNDKIASQDIFFLACFICAACNFFLPTSAGRNFGFKITPPPPSRVKWSAPKWLFLLREGLARGNSIESTRSARSSRTLHIFKLQRPTHCCSFH